MNFQDLNKVEDSDFYLDIAFKKAKEKTELHRKKIKIKDNNRMAKSKAVEIYRMEVAKDSLVNSLDKILKSFPTFTQLPEFYLELIRCSTDLYQIKKSLSSVNWASKKINGFFREYKDKIKKVQLLEKVNEHRRGFYGRICSVMKEIKKDLKLLEENRKILKQLPTIKTSVRTIAIAGFPNVGKTTLMYKLTGSKPEISNYAFTTKRINVSYVKRKDEKIQILDTPGTLNRFNKMNFIEKQAHLAMKLVAEKIIYVFDLTETYDLEDQVALYKNIKKFGKPVMVYLSKTDIIDKKVIEEFKKKHKIEFVTLKEIKEKL